MKLYKVELFVVDFGEYGVDDFLLNVEQNTDGIVHCFNKKEVDLLNDDWSDDHELNMNDVTRKQCNKYFK